TLVSPDGSSELITSYTYDAYGRLTQKVMPKGNLGRTIATDGVLSGTADTTYATAYTYYAPAATASPAGTCSGSSADQGGQLKSQTPHGIAATTYVYDTAGDPASKANGRGVTCFTYDNERRLSSEIAPGDGAPTTFSYDPTGAQRTETDASGTLATSYDEAGRVTLTTDSWGATAQMNYDAAGNLV